MIPAPAVDGRRVERFFQELRTFAPHYTPDLDLSAVQSPGVALMRIFAQLAEAVSERLDRAPDKHFVAFLDRLGITLIPARPARAAVTFRLVAGLETFVTVPAGTRVTASGATGEIPFETSSELVAIPGALAAVYGVDPAKDVIFRPPPDFLKQEPRPTTELQYRTQAFAAAGAKRLQLDHITGLQPGAFVRIDCRDKQVVSKVDQGGIVTLQEPLVRDVAASATVTPIRDFEVFDGIDLQEHILYLGHGGILTVKNEAKVTVSVRLKRAGRQPLDLVWQFWTKDETPSPENEEHWHELSVPFDGTAGFTTSGDVYLVKPDDLEIKPRKVAGVENRWIRARLREKLTSPAETLPLVDSLAIAVESRVQGGILADQGFNNAIPLDVQVDEKTGFFPFGTEPRQFDQFYIASKEAFSKPHADVTLHFRLDLQTLADPSVALAKGASAPEPRAYAIGLRRRLYELTAGNWEILGNPSTAGSGTSEATQYLPAPDSAPSAIADDNGDKLLIFVNAVDSLDPDNTSKLWVMLRRADGTQATWVDLDAPPATGGKKQLLQFDPAAVRLPTALGFSRVFVVGKDGELYSQLVSDSPVGPSNWESHGSPVGAALTSSPFPSFEPSTQSVLVYVTGKEGDSTTVYEFRPGAMPPWRALAADPAISALSRPFARVFADAGRAEAKVLVTASDTAAGPSRLFECDTRVPGLALGTFQWKDLGRPTGADGLPVDVAGAPAGHIEEAIGQLGKEGKHIFVRAADNRLYERIDDSAQQWTRRSRPGEPELRGSPAAIATPVTGDTRTRLDVFAASSRNSLVQTVFEIARGTVSATDAGLAVLLKESNASPVDGAYTQKILEMKKGANPATQETITAYDGGLKLARLQNPQTPPVDSSFTCKIVNGDDLEDARDHADRIFPFHGPPADAHGASAVYVRLNDTFKTFRFYSRVTGLVSLQNAGDAPAGTRYALYAEHLDGAGESRPPEETNVVPDLSWEYWNGRGWLSLKVRSDGTRDLLTNGAVVFADMPAVQPVEVAGQENFWIRARLVGGDYGRETFRVVKDKVVSEKSSLRPPKVKTLRITYVAAPAPPEACLTFNNLDYLDQTAAAQLSGAQFLPFEPLEDTALTVFFGFDHAFKTGPVRLLIDAAEREFDPSTPPDLAWSFRKDHRWKALDADDGSVALTRQGVLTISAPDALTVESRFGKPLFWVKGTLRGRVPAASYPRPLLRGVFPNTVEATHGETITDEIVGSSDGEPAQTLTLQHADVLGDEDIRVQERLSSEEREEIERDQGRGSVVARDDIGGTWVRWKETRAFFDSGPKDRCYSIDRASGILRFGDGTHGAIPPAGVDNIRAFRYRTGGGAAGNLAAGRITTLATSVEGVESVFNPTPTGGGSDKADTAAMVAIGPRQISHRDRAVSPLDFEALAYAATRQVARARCLAATNLKRSGAGRPDPCDPLQRHDAATARGWVSLIIVPKSLDPKPCPSLELRRTVSDYLRERAPGLLVAGDRLVIRPPDYVEVSIKASLFVTSLEQAARVEAAAQGGLSEFLHPLRGGTDKTGWEFGRAISKSDVFGVLEKIPEVDRVENLTFEFNGRSSREGAEIGPNELLASGTHVLAIQRA